MEEVESCVALEGNYAALEGRRYVEQEY